MGLMCLLAAHLLQYWSSLCLHLERRLLLSCFYIASSSSPPSSRNTYIWKKVQKLRRQGKCLPYFEDTSKSKTDRAKKKKKKEKKMVSNLLSLLHCPLKMQEWSYFLFVKSLLSTIYALNAKTFTVIPICIWTWSREAYTIGLDEKMET